MAGLDSIQVQIFKAISKNFPGGLSAVPVIPIGFTYPVAKLGPLMDLADAEPNGSNERTFGAKLDRKDYALLTVKCILMGRDPLFGHPVLVRVRDVGRCLRNLPFAG